MPIPPFESAETMKLFVSQSQLEEWIEALPHLSPSDLAEISFLLNKQPSIESQKKMEAVLQFVDQTNGWEFLGKSFSVQHFVSFLSMLNFHPKFQERLTSVLIGLNSLVFSQALNFLQTSHLNLLKHEGSQEPLQYHLNQFVHEGETLQKKIDQQITLYNQELQAINPHDLSAKRLENLMDRMDTLRSSLLDYLERANTALAITWNTDRIDLIDRLSSINESLQSQLAHFVGHPSSDHLPSTGLYLVLEESFSRIFDQSLKDEDAAIEGLTRLSIWHLKDYWELGLLPFVNYPQELDLDPQQFSENERIAHQQQLFSRVQQQLNQLNIGTVGKLKKKHLFSKFLLKNYIEQNQHLLQTS